MADHREPDLDGDYSSSFQKTVILRDWWLIKCSNEFNGKRFGVAGIEITDPYGEKRATRVFRSSPIITAFDVFTLESSNGILIVLRGFLDKERVAESGFNPEISREFIFGFPPHWEHICNKCYEGIPFSNDITTIPSSIIIDKASYSVLSPCKNNTEGNVEDSVVVAESRDNDKSAVAVRKDGRRSSGGFRESLRLRSKSGEDDMEVEFSKAENRTTTDIGDDHGLDKVNESEAFDNEAILPAADRCGGKQTDVVDNVESGDYRSVVTETNDKDGRTTSGFRKSLRIRSKSGGNNAEDETELELSKVENRTTTNDGDADHGTEGFEKANSTECEAIDKEVIALRKHTGLDKVNECEAIDNEVISPVDGSGGRKHTDVADYVDVVMSTNGGDGGSMASEQRKDEVKVRVTRASSRSLFKDLDKRSSKSPKKSGKTCKTVGNVVDEPMNPTRKDGDHGSEDANKSNDVEKDVDNEVKISTVEDSIGKLTSKNDMKETETSEQRKGKAKMVSKLGKKGEPKKSDGQNRVVLEAMNHPSLRSKLKKVVGKLKKSEKACKSDREVVVEAMNHRSLRSKVKETEGKLKKSEKTRKSDRNEAVVEPTNHHNLKSKVKEAERKSKKTDKTRKRNRDDEVVEDPMNHRSPRSKVKEADKNLSWAKTRRKIDFDAEVTPVKEAKKKEKTDAGTTGSLRRSRSGRALVSPLAFWRNEIPVYDRVGTLIEVKGDDETPTPRR